MANPKVQFFKAFHDPQDIKDYGRNYTDFLDTDEDITASAWAITSEDEATPTLIEDTQGNSISIDLKSTAIFVSGGTDEIDYVLTNHITTLDDDGNIRQYDRETILRCRST